MVGCLCYSPYAVRHVWNVADGNSTKIKQYPGRNNRQTPVLFLTDKALQALHCDSHIIDGCGIGETYHLL